jgi:RNA polymerase-binding transcription factor DksA
MYYIVATAKSVSDATRDLTAAVERHKFGVLHIHDLAATLERKGYPLGAECKVFEVCNPQHAARILARDMRVNMALPCRISVFQERGVTQIGTILPTETLRMLSPDPELAEVAASVETTVKAIIDDAAAPQGARQALVLRRATLAREIEAGIEKRRGEPGGNVPDSGELAAAAVEREVDIAEVDRDVAEVEAIDAALERLEQGTYGRCVGCGAEIERARLAHSPEAARCTPCQQAEEQKTPRRIARL